MARTDIKHGDFTGLAENYSKYRPAYAPSVRDAIFGLLSKPAAEVIAADVGAGTGIWSRMLAGKAKHVHSVEPNDDMRTWGERDCRGLPVDYRKGSGEATGLPDQSVDLVSMASSFHWVDFEKGTQEFHRILKPNGRFVALWNPRLIEVNPLLVEIEDQVRKLTPAIKRVSSGSSGITEALTEKLWSSPLFDDVIYMEGRHTVNQTPEQYIGVWNSVNDIRFQMGPEKWEEFMSYVADRVKDKPHITTTYRTRAWSARRR